MQRTWFTKKHQVWGVRISCVIILFMLTSSVPAYALGEEKTEEFCPYCEKAKEYQRLFSLQSLTFQPAAAAPVTANHPILYLFWGNGCPHCAEEKEFLALLREQYPQLEMRFFEVWDHPDFAELGEAMGQAYHIEVTSAPLTFLGEWSMIGFRSFEENGIEIDNQIRKCLQQGCIDALDKVASLDIVARIRSEAAQNTPTDWQLYLPSAAPEQPAAMQVEQSPAEPTPGQVATPKPFQLAPLPTPSQVVLQNVNPPDPNAITVPLLGKITVSWVGLPLFTVFIGMLDGFNPCAMWVLCFLLTLVIYAKSRAKILLIGGIFIVASGVIYFFFMAAWLNLFLFVGYVKPLRIAVGVVAVVMGLINCKDFFFFKQGVSLTIPEAAQPKLFKKMRVVVNTAALPGMIAGTIALAVTANLIELLCTAGFPAIYTRILTLQNFSTAQYYLYLAFYNVVYVIPLAVIVGVFAWKMGGRKLTEKEGRILKISGRGFDADVRDYPACEATTADVRVGCRHPERSRRAGLTSEWILERIGEA